MSLYMIKVAYIIPGFGHSATKNKPDKHIASLFKTKGMNPVLGNFSWKYKPLSE